MSDSVRHYGLAIACRAPLSMGLSRQEYWSVLPFPPPWALPDPGMEPVSPASPSLEGGFFTNEPPEKPGCSVLVSLLFFC